MGSVMGIDHVLMWMSGAIVMLSIHANAQKRFGWWLGLFAVGILQFLAGAILA